MDASRGFIDTLPDATVTNAQDRVVWTLKPYGFLSSTEAPPTVNPSLWRQSQLNMNHGLFEVCDRKWRGVCLIPKSGFKLRYEYRDHDAERLFEVDDIETQESPVCISGQILKGMKKPHECPAFGKQCTPQTPLGATMVSAEGACAAYHAYGRHLEHSKAQGLQPRGLGGRV